jgi:hypothetical protein
MYLVEALKYDVPAFHEDRLTQIVAATFNSSESFRRLFLRFLKVPIKRNLVARTQVSNEEAPSRPDLIIYSSETPYILIESKVDAKADKSQQNRHSRLRAMHNFLIVRDAVSEESVHHHFQKINWYDFFSFLLPFNKAKPRTPEEFLIQQLICFGKECDMLMPEKITKDDFKLACNFFTSARLRKFPFGAYGEDNPFKALDRMSQFLDRILIKIREDEFLSPKIKVFKRSFTVGSTFDRELRDGLKENGKISHEDIAKSDNIGLQKSISLKRQINGFNCIFLRIDFVPHYQKHEVSSIDARKLRKIDINKIIYRGEISAGLSFRGGSFFDSDSLIFDDTDDLEFSDFYFQAVRHWKRKLKKQR